MFLDTPRPYTSSKHLKVSKHTILTQVHIRNYKAGLDTVSAYDRNPLRKYIELVEVYVENQ